MTQKGLKPLSCKTLPKAGSFLCVEQVRALSPDIQPGSSPLLTQVRTFLPRVVLAIKLVEMSLISSRY